MSLVRAALLQRNGKLIPDDILKKKAHIYRGPRSIPIDKEIHGVRDPFHRERTNKRTDGRTGDRRAHKLQSRKFARGRRARGGSRRRSPFRERKKERGERGAGFLRYFYATADEVFPGGCNFIKRVGSNVSVTPDQRSVAGRRTRNRRCASVDIDLPSVSAFDAEKKGASRPAS